jgi:toxin ParE1/3/4
MKRLVVWAESARSEYLAIIRYIARDNPDAAERVARRIADAGAALGEFSTGRPGRVKGTYEKVVHGLPYILAYEIIPRSEGGERVAILHVIHGARNWPEDLWPGK